MSTICRLPSQQTNIRLNKLDVKVLKELRKLSGVVSNTELIRLAIRIAVAYKARFPIS